MKKVIRLTESELHRIVMESANEVISSWFRGSKVVDNDGNLIK